jgi:RNA polymerase primary sigma factor
MKSRTNTVKIKMLLCRNSSAKARQPGSGERPSWQAQQQDPTLGRYFQELADHDVLDCDTEAQAAKEIAGLEIERWRVIFSEPTSAQRIAEALQARLKSEYSAQEMSRVAPLLAAVKRKAVRANGNRRGRVAFAHAVHGLAQELYELDLRRELVILAHKEVMLASAGSAARRAGSDAHAKAAKAIACQVERAKHVFIQANLRLVVAIARRYDRGKMQLIDLIQEGNLGLIKAVERYDYRRGFRFSTYASWWIRHAIGRALADKGQAVRVPVHALDMQHRLVRAVDLIGMKLGRTPTDEELAKETGIDRRRLAKARKRAVAPMCSLDRELSNVDDRCYVDLLVDDEYKNPFEATLLRSWIQDMNKVLDVLTPMEQTIIRWRYGLDDCEEMTLKEIGEHYKLSRERIRQLQEQALRKIRKYMALDAA